MIKSFRDKETRAIFEGENTKAARRRLPTQLWKKARAQLDEIDAATEPKQLAGDRAGQHAIRINLQYRICFQWQEKDAWDLEITDYHD